MINNATLILLFVIGCISIVVGYREHKKEQRDDRFFLADKLKGRCWLLNVVETTRESTKRLHLK